MILKSHETAEFGNPYSQPGRFLISGIKIVRKFSGLKVKAYNSAPPGYGPYWKTLNFYNPMRLPRIG